MRIIGKARFIGVLVALLAVSGMFAFGCGGGEKIDLSGKGGDSGKAAVSATKDSGSESDATDQGSSDSGTSSAESDSAPGKVSKDADAYASDFCGAIAKYANDIQELSNAEADMEDPAAMKGFIGQMVPIFEGISKDLGKIEPPDEVADWHKGLVSGMSEIADLFTQMGDALDKPLDEAMTEITDLSSEISNTNDPFSSMGDLPQEYQTAFENNSDCQDLQALEIFQ